MTHGCTHFSRDGDTRVQVTWHADALERVLRDTLGIRPGPVYEVQGFVPHLASANSAPIATVHELANIEVQTHRSRAPLRCAVFFRFDSCNCVRVVTYISVVKALLRFVPGVSHIRPVRLMACTSDLLIASISAREHVQREEGHTQGWARLAAAIASASLDRISASASPYTVDDGTAPEGAGTSRQQARLLALAHVCANLGALHAALQARHASAAAATAAAPSRQPPSFSASRSGASLRHAARPARHGAAHAQSPVEKLMASAERVLLGDPALRNGEGGRAAHDPSTSAREASTTAEGDAHAAAAERATAAATATAAAARSSELIEMLSLMQVAP